MLIILYLEEPSYNQALEFLFLICYLTTFLWKWGSNVNIELVVKIDFTRIIFVTSIYFHPVIAVWTSNEFYTLVFFFLTYYSPVILSEHSLNFLVTILKSTWSHYRLIFSITRKEHAVILILPELCKEAFSHVFELIWA